MRKDRFNIRTVLMVMVCLLVTATSILAQSDTSSISGTITDSSGAVVPDAQITIHNNATLADRNRPCIRRVGNADRLFVNLDQFLHILIGMRAAEAFKVRRHQFLPFRFLGLQQLQQNILTVNWKDLRHIARPNPRESILKFLPQIRDGECTEIPACRSSRIR